MVTAQETRATRWPHWLAVLTVCAMLPLLTLGAEVTTKQVGMVDPKGFRWPWEIVALLSDRDNAASLGLVIELTHRMFGFLVGILSILLCVSLGRTARGWKRWLGLAALAAVVAQGLLGRYRVDLNALFGSTLALIHGCFAQLVFALLVSIAVWTSPSWQAAPGEEPRNMGPLRRWSLLVAGLIYLQIILGALVRHRDFVLGARLHLLMAFAVVAAVAWLVKLVYDMPREERRGGRVVVLSGLVFFQLLLGIEAWLSKFAVPETLARQVEPLTGSPHLVRSAHYLVGALVFSTSVVTVLWMHRHLGWSPRPVTTPVHSVEAAS
jgi:cytochrome c oxidase assembly protein subunit 15